MLKNIRKTRSRSDSIVVLKDSDYIFFMDETGLSYEEIERFFKLFQEKGGKLNKPQFKECFALLTRNWLGHFSDSSKMSDQFFRAFDKGDDLFFHLKKNLIFFLFFKIMMVR